MFHGRGWEKVYDSKATLDLLYTTGPKAIRIDVRDTPSALASAGGGVVAYLHCCWNL